MKLAFLLINLQLFHTAVTGEGGLRTATENKLEEHDPIQLFHDSETSRRRELQTRPLRSQKGVSHIRNLTETGTCGDGPCSSDESISNCPADCSNLVFATSNSGKKGAHGHMFYIKAKRDISIYSFDIFSGTPAENELVQVYTRMGKYSGFELKEDSWNLVYDNDSVNLLGEAAPTSLGDFDSAVTVSEGTFQSFFIWVPNNRVRYQLGSSEGSRFSHNKMINFFEGVGVTSKFSGPYDEHFHPPRVFFGVIRYDAVSLSQNIDPLSSAVSLIQNGDPLSLGIPTQARAACLATQRRVNFAINTDYYGYETEWQFRKKGHTDPIFQGPEDDSNYISSGLYQGSVCVGIGMYEFIITDDGSDGLCCGAYGDGFYKVDVLDENGTWKEAVKGGDFQGSKTHVIDVGHTESTMTDRDKAYLVAHNKRRIDWHGRYNKEYRPLKWSKGLKDNSMIYAVELLDTCRMGPPKHAKNNPYGENLARNQGNGFWGQLYDPDLIVNRFVEREEGLDWPANAHLTNALWRATSYVGCAEAGKSYEVINKRGQTVTHNCRVQVCRYSKAGNCGMANFRDETGYMDWETAVMQDDSSCKPDCPPEGCFNE